MEIFYFILFIATIVLIFVTANAARKRGRSGLGWFLLACIGDTEEKKRDKMYEEELIRKEIWRSNSSRTEEPTVPSPHIPQKSGKTINDLYKR
jgi:hypothetical protein